MAEYIEREALLDRVCAVKDKLQLDLNNLFEDGVGIGFENVEMEIENFPAADVRPVVLCRDCKYWFNAPAADGFNSCERDALIRHEGFFCAAGEKREES